MKLKNKIVTLAASIAMLFGVAVAKNDVTKVDAAGATTVTTVIADYADEKGWSNSVQYKTVEMDANIIVTAEGTDTNTGRYYTSGENWRMYQAGSPEITFTAINGCQMSSIAIEYIIDKTGVLTFDGDNIESGDVVEVSGTTATFGVGNTGSATNGQVRITKMSVTYAGGDIRNTIAALDTNVQLGLSYYKNIEVSEGDVAEPTTVATVIKDYAGENSWSNGTKYESVEMDANITVTAKGTDSNTGKYYTSGYEWRTYQTGKPSITFTANNGCEISSIKITYNLSNSGTLTFNGSNIQSGTAVDVSGTTVTFGVGNTGSATNGQVKITKMEVTYTSSGPTETITYDTFCNAKLRYVANVPVSLVDALDFDDDNFGFELTLGEQKVDYTLKNANITVEEEDGSYTFALIVSVPEENYDDVVRARAFVTVAEDGEVAYLSYTVVEEGFSVKSLAQYYVDNNVFEKDHIEEQKAALETFLGL